MQKSIPIVVFTGAGASRAEPISLPTMTEFFQQIMTEDRRPKSPRITNTTYFKFIFDSLYESNNDYDLERIMGALYGLSDFTNNDCWKIFQNPIIFNNIIKKMGTGFNGIRQTGTNSVLSLDSARNLIVQATEDTYLSYKEDAKELIFELEWLIRENYEKIPYEHIRTVYEPLFELLIEKTLNAGDGASSIIPFFTTNYDMSVDWFFEPWDNKEWAASREWESKFSKEITYIDGFSKRGWSEKEYNYINEDDNSKIFIPYFKLHGSLYWERVSGHVRMGTNVANDPHSPNELMIVYPSDKKILLDQPYYFNHKQLEYYLRKAENLIIIGFSFRDPGIVRTFEEAMRNNASMKIHVIGPKFDESKLPEARDFIKNKQVKQIIGNFGTEDVLRDLKKMLYEN